MTAAVLAFAAGLAADIRCIDPDPATGSSVAVVVGPAPLAHTAQLLPLDRDGKLVAAGRPDAQAAAALDNVAAALAEVGSGLDRVVMLNVYARSDEAIDGARRAIAKRFTGTVKPAVGFVVTPLAHPEALVAFDAVAVAGDGGPKVKRVAVEMLSKAAAGATVAVLPSGKRVYVAGQAEKGDLATATRETLGSLRKTLTFLGLTDADVVECKAFLQPMTEAATVVKEFEAVFGVGNVPPLALVEWKSGKETPIEIELVAAAGPATKDDPAIEFLTPPGMTTPTIYSRVARVAHPQTIYVGGLIGEGATGKEQVEAIFEKMRRHLQAAGGDFRHLVKATYYVSSEDASTQLNKLRPNYYDPKRPPAASKAMIAATGVAGRTITIDMIAVPAAK